jgi:nucleoside-diphosphate-sugar epimerase
MDTNNKTMTNKLNVLVTGPGGRIGKHVLPTLRERFLLRLMDKNPLPDELTQGDGQVTADLSDQSVLETACEGIDAILHLAATSDEAPFLEELVPNNVEGLFRLLEAARIQGVKRVVFASTVQTVGRNAPGTITTDALPHPISLYGATKLLGEAMGRHYFHKHGIEFVAVRIGWFLDYPDIQKQPYGRDVWLSPRDAAEIFARSLEMPGVDNITVFATSITEKERLSRAPLKQFFDYVPQDNVVDYPYEAPTT